MHGDGAVGQQGPRGGRQITAESAPLPVAFGAIKLGGNSSLVDGQQKRTSMEGFLS